MKYFPNEFFHKTPFFVLFCFLNEVPIEGHNLGKIEMERKAQDLEFNGLGGQIPTSIFTNDWTLDRQIFRLGYFARKKIKVLINLKGHRNNLIRNH